MKNMDREFHNRYVFCLLLWTQSLSSVMTWAADSSCSYTFNVWHPDENIQEKVRNLEYQFTNVTNYIDKTFLELKIQLYYEMNRMCPIAGGSRGQRRAGSKVKERDLNGRYSGFQRELNDLIKRIHMLANDYADLRNKIPSRHPTTTTTALPPPTMSGMAAMIEEQNMKYNGVMNILENNLNDLKAEWILMKRDLRNLNKESSHLKHAQNGIMHSSIKINETVEKLDEKVLELEKTVQGTQADRGSRISQSLLDIRSLKDDQSKFVSKVAVLGEKVDNITTLTKTMTAHLDLLKGDNAYLKRMMLAASKAKQSGKEATYTKQLTHGSPDKIPTDCQDIYYLGLESSGIYQIKPKGARFPDDVYCQFVNNTAYTVIQRRTDGLLNFNRRWIEYKFGFGNMYSEFWLGNEWIHMLSNQRHYTLRIDMWDWEGNKVFAEYQNFNVSGSDQDYKLHVGDFVGDAGDSLSYHNNMKFSTEDVDNDVNIRNCAADNKAGWWFNTCYFSNLNGVYYIGWYSQAESSFSNGIVWYTFKEKESYSLRKVEMKIRRM